MKTSDFFFDLPPELIAQEPLAERSASRMLVLDRETGGIEHRHVTDLPGYLRAGDLLVVNDTRVVPARVFGRRHDTGGRVELLLLETGGDAVWESYYRASRPPRAGLLLELGEGAIRGEVLEVLPGGRVRVRLQADGPLLDVLEEHGVPPLPPYIKRSAGDPRTARDRLRYQTVYASRPGAVAAPTAGLHFTPELFARLEEQGVRRAVVTLHVGPGTFKPVSCDDVRDHVMEDERYELDAETAAAVDAARARGGRVVAVGSTTVRTLETVAREHGGVVADEGRSDLFIYPPFEFRVVDVMLTNFHLPRSTLIMMVCALAGRERVLAAYEEAVRMRYRFYSYGDCMLIT